VVTFTPRLLYPQEKSPRYQLDRRLGGPQVLQPCRTIKLHFKHILIFRSVTEFKSVELVRKCDLGYGAVKMRQPENRRLSIVMVD